MAPKRKEEAELERIAKNLLAMPHTDRDKTKFKVRRKKKPRKLKLGTKKPSTYWASVKFLVS